MRAAALTATLAALALAACGDPAPQAPAQPAWPQPIDRADPRTWFDRPLDLDGLDPAWSAQVRRETITVTPPNAAPLTFPNTPPTVTGGDAAWRATSPDGIRLELNLRSLWCAVLPTDAARPFSVHLRLIPAAGEPATLQGCGSQIPYRFRAGRPSS